MKKLVIAVFLVVVLAGITAPAQAMTTGTFNVAWSNISGFDYKWSTANNGVWDAGLRGANNGIALGGFDPDPVGGGVINLGLVWCVDLFNYTGTTDSYYAERYTDADGASSAAAWVNPVGDGDDLRSAAGLGQAAYLANKYGSLVNTVQKKHALQMAIWQAAYGTNRFLYNSGGDIDAVAYAGFLADITSGQTSAQYEWYDNNQSGNHYQDFINDVPEPSSMLLLGGALLSAALGWRKRKQA